MVSGGAIFGNLRDRYAKKVRRKRGIVEKVGTRMVMWAPEWTRKIARQAGTATVVMRNGKQIKERSVRLTKRMLRIRGGSVALVPYSQDFKSPGLTATALR